MIKTLKKKKIRSGFATSYQLNARILQSSLLYFTTCLSSFLFIFQIGKKAITDCRDKSPPKGAFSQTVNVISGSFTQIFTSMGEVATVSPTPIQSSFWRSLPGEVFQRSQPEPRRFKRAVPEGLALCHQTCRECAGGPGCARPPPPRDGPPAPGPWEKGGLGGTVLLSTRV